MDPTKIPPAAVFRHLGIGRLINRSQTKAGSKHKKQMCAPVSGRSAAVLQAVRGKCRGYQDRPNQGPPFRQGELEL